MRSSIHLWYEDYQSKGGHSRMGGERRPQTTNEKKEMVRATLNGHTMMPPKLAATQAWTESHDNIEFSDRKFKLHPYQLQMQQKSMVWKAD